MNVRSLALLGMTRMFYINVIPNIVRNLMTVWTNYPYTD